MRVRTFQDSSSFAETSDCGSELAAGASCIVTVGFAPRLPGVLSASVTLATAEQGSFSFSVQGTGTESKVTPAALRFGNQRVGTASAPQAVTLSVVGPGVVYLTDMSIVGTNSSDFSEVNKCGSLLQSGQRCGIRVTFGPTATGMRTASLAVQTSNAGVSSTQYVALTGTGR